MIICIAHLCVVCSPSGTPGFPGNLQRWAATRLPTDVAQADTSSISILCRVITLHRCGGASAGRWPCKPTFPGAAATAACPQVHISWPHKNYLKPKPANPQAQHLPEAMACALARPQARRAVGNSNLKAAQVHLFLQKVCEPCMPCESSVGGVWP